MDHHTIDRVSFQTAEALPAPRLRPFIARYGAYRAQATDLGPTRGFPSRYVTVMIGLGSPFQVAGVGSFTSFVAGLHERAVVVESAGTVAGIHLFLDPLATRAILGCPASAVAQTVISLADVIGTRTAAELHERLHEARTWEGSFAVVDDVLQRRLVDAPSPREVGFAWNRITARHGLGRVEPLAAAIGWSRRHLTECFRSEVGITPKTLARIARFERACALLRYGPRDLAGAAVTAGYHDQAHMTHEWQALAGCTPRTWIAQELPFLQDYEFVDLDDDTGGQRTGGRRTVSS
ncbi:MAG: helix-turn-helix domain-containing protein [Steroidobacteraceae bacterium]